MAISIAVQRSIASFSIEARVQLFIAYLSAMHLWLQNLEKGTWALYICKSAGDLYKDHVLKLNVFRSCISLPSLVLGGPAMLACVPDETFARDIFLKRTPPTLQVDWPRHDLEHSVKTWLYNSIVGRNIRMVALQWSFCESGHIVILLKTGEVNAWHECLNGTLLLFM